MKAVQKNIRKIIAMGLGALLLFNTVIPISAKAQTIKLGKPQLAAFCLSKTAVSLKVKKVSNATGYIFYRSKQKSVGYSAIKTSNLNAYEDGGLTEGDYYYKVMAYANMKGKKYYSPYSSVAYVKVSATARISSVISDTNGFDFTPYDSITKSEYNIGLVGNLVYTYDGSNTKYYGPDATLIATFSGDATSAFGILSNAYVKKNEGEYTYRDTWVNASGKLDASEDWYSDFVWVKDTIINIKTGKVLNQYKFEGIYGTSLFVSTTDFIDGIALIRVDGKYGMMDENGNIVVKPLYKSGFVISGGYAIFENSDGKWAYCDKTGSMSEFKFTALRDGGHSGILIGEIDKKYVYSTQEGNLLNLSEKRIINHGKEYSLCANLPNCSVDLGNFSDDYAHAAIRYYYVDLKLDLQSYLAFDGYVDTQGAKKLDFTDHSKEDMNIALGLADIPKMDINAALKPISLETSTKPSIDNSSNFKYGLLLADMKGLSVSVENGADTQSKDFFAGYGVYDKTGKQLFYLSKDGIKEAKIVGNNCIAVHYENNLLTLKNSDGATRLSVPNVSNYEVIQSDSGYPIVTIYTNSMDGNTVVNSSGVYYGETNFYTGQYYANVRKAYIGNDDVIFPMKDGKSYLVASKNKILIPATECDTIKPTGDGYAIVKMQAPSSSTKYSIDFYNADGKSVTTVKADSYSISALCYGQGGMMFTDNTVILDNRYYSGLGKQIGNEIFFVDRIGINHGYTFVRKLNDENYALMSSDGKLLSGYSFTKKDAIYHSNYTPNKYGSMLIYLDGRLFRVHSYKK